MKNVISLSVQNIKDIIISKNIEKMKDWDGDMDGGELERFLDDAIPNWIRFYHDKEDNVLMMNKKMLDDAIDKVDYLPILQRMKDRVQVDNYQTEYLDWYYEVLDPIYIPIIGEETQWVYLRLYDYILDRVSGNHKYEFLVASIENQAHLYAHWRDQNRDDPIKFEKYDYASKEFMQMIYFHPVQEYPPGFKP